MLCGANRTLNKPRRSRVSCEASRMRTRALMAVFMMAMSLLGAALLCASPAAAAQSSRLTSEEKEQLFKEHQVHNTASPQGVRVDVYDYWLSSQSAQDTVNPNGYLDMGINRPAGEQAYLKFGKDMRGQGINAWTESAQTRVGIVDNRLGDDGYPWIAKGNVYDTAHQDQLTQPQSLKYLFDGSAFEGKRAHVGATGLLQLDQDGYYYYNSKQNHAWYNPKSNSFTLYDSPAVTASGKDKQFGQFFPFNEPKNVYPGTVKDGKLESFIAAYNGLMKHYFGLQLAANFMQPVDGITKGDEPMVFEFTGDDDVWVFIDGVLVGDVGGIHDRCGLSIDFSTGAVFTYDGSSYGNKSTHYTDTTIKERFKAALGEDFDPDRFKGDTFADGTYHTLQFYYLERGNHNSNMALKFNLVSVPQSTMTKVDQLGRPVEGATFDLYATGDNYEVRPDAVPVATGTTDGSGRFTFTMADGSPLNFMSLYAEQGFKRYVLREVSAPQGHRLSPDGRLKYVVSEKDPTLGFIFSDNYWDSGVYAHAEQVVTIEGDTVYGAGGPEEADKYNVDDGAVFAVIYRQDAAAGLWHHVSGGTYQGWRVSQDPVTTVEELRGAQIYQFAKDSSGKYSIDVKEMPGNPEDYYLMVGDGERARYTVGFYFTTAVAGGKVDQTKLDASNTFRLPGDQFARQSAANLYVTDILNVLAVQKVDEQGRPVNGAQFGLYAAADMQQQDGFLVPAPTAKPLHRETTKTLDKDQAISGEGLLLMSGLDRGDYYLVEERAPEGYEANPVAVRVIVDKDGVHVDAGTKTDGVTAMVSTGSLVDSMAEFAAKDDIDMTLFDIVASCSTAASSEVQDAEGDVPVIAWTQDTNPQDDLWLTHGAADKVLDYGADINMPNGRSEIAYTVTEGFGMARVRQNGAYADGSAPGPAAKRYGRADWTNLGERDLTSLYTGATCVIVENKRQASLTVKKYARIAGGLVGPTAAGEDGERYSTLADQKFYMRLALTDGKGGPLTEGYEAAIWENVDGVPVCVHTINNVVKDDVFYMHGGQWLEVYGLPEGTRYKVEELDEASSSSSVSEPSPASSAYSKASSPLSSPYTMPAGFVQVDAQNTEGIITSDGAQASFTNEYRATGTLEIPVTKRFNRWDLVPEGFTFELRAHNDAPMPEGAVDSAARITIVAGAEGSTLNDERAAFFLPITYAKAGEYMYYVAEARPQEAVPGVTYSDAAYRVGVIATDRGDGTLAIEMTTSQLTTDDGSPADGWPVPGGTPLFTNAFDADKTAFAPSALKEYVDWSGARPLEDGMFEFKVEVLAGNPIPGKDSEPAVAPQDMTFTVGNKGNVIETRQAWFTSDMIRPNPYVYTFYEVMPAGANAENAYTVEGITYDPAVYKAEVTVSAVPLDNAARAGAKVAVDVQYYKKSSLDVDDWQPVDAAVFHNECHPQPSGAVALGGAKVLRGRDLLAGELFSFDLEPADDLTRAALDSGVILVAGDNGFDHADAAGNVGQVGAESWVTEVGALQRVPGESATYAGDFSFPAMTFTLPGVYRFKMAEQMPSSPAKGMTYDKHEVLVTVTVRAQGADLALVADVAYDNSGATAAQSASQPAASLMSTPANKAVFTNVYNAVGAADSLGLTVKLTLDGREMRAGEFEFEIAGAGDTPEEAQAAQDKLLNATDRRFKNPRPTHGVAHMPGKLEDLVFTQDDAGRTFTYRIAQKLPAGATAQSPVAAGVTYDLTVYEYRLTPVIDDSGELGLAAELYKVRGANGLSENTLLYRHDPADGAPQIGDDIRVAAFANSYGVAPVALTADWCELTKHLDGRAWQDGDRFEFAMERVSYQASADSERLTSGAQFDAMPMPAPAEVTAASLDYATADGGTAPGVKRFGFESVAFSAPGIFTYRVYELEPKVGAIEGVAYSDEEVSVVVTVVDEGLGRLVAYVDVDGVPTDKKAHFTNVFSGGGVEPPVDPEPEPEPEPDPEPEPEPELEPRPEPGPDPEPEPGPDPDQPVDPRPEPDPTPDPKPDPDDPGEDGGKENPNEPGTPEDGDSSMQAMPGTGDDSFGLIAMVGTAGTAVAAVGLYLLWRRRR